jgi:hypothetical protein
MRSRAPVAINLNLAVQREAALDRITTRIAFGEGLLVGAARALSADAAQAATSA